MQKILFTHAYLLRYDPKQWNNGQPYPPLGTMYATACAREKGYNVRFEDSMFFEDAGQIENSINDFQPHCVVIYDDGFNYLTKMCLQNMREAAFEMIRIAKVRGCRVFVSSSDSTDRFDQYLQAGADVVMLGEAEETLISLLEHYQKPKVDLFQVQGIAFMHEHAVVKTNRRAVMRELDQLPMPAWDLLNIEPYRKAWLKSTGYFSLNIGTTRGCPFKCNWCAKPIYGNRYHSRSPENVVSEIKMLKDKFQFDHIWFCDDIFGLKPGWVKRFADILEAEQLKFRFKMQGRVDLLLEADAIKDLARAGCESIWMGAESGSQKILDAMDKGTTVEQIREATNLLKKYGIKPSFFIQFGYPGETRKDIELTIRMINDLLPHEIGISVSYPLPGTVFHERVKNDLQEKTNWTDSDELALMFRNTYQPAFYKQLHRYVHQSYKKHIAVENMRKLLQRPMSMRKSNFRKAISFFYYAPSSILQRMKLSRLEHQTA